jgi:hypothetical protein
MKQALMTVANWIWNKITNIDYAMIAAAFVEVPRWAVAFAAIREPMWAAVPMGLLLAWAASAGRLVSTTATCRTSSRRSRP